jgi:hypothetical protein
VISIFVWCSTVLLFFFINFSLPDMYGM